MYASDTPSLPMAVDGFSLVYAAYGLLGAWILRPFSRGGTGSGRITTV